METLKADGCKSVNLSALILMLSEYLDLNPTTTHLTPLLPIDIQLVVNLLTRLVTRPG